jgi:hypothetical protein
MNARCMGNRIGWTNRRRATHTKSAAVTYSIPFSELDLLRASRGVSVVGEATEVLKRDQLAVRRRLHARREREREVVLGRAGAALLPDDDAVFRRVCARCGREVDLRGATVSIRMREKDAEGIR